VKRLAAIAVIACTAITARGEDISALVRRGERALESKAPDEAIDVFKECQQQSPRYNVCAFGLARAYSLKNDARTGVEWLARAADLGWDDIRKVLEDPTLATVRAHPDFVFIAQMIQDRLPSSAPRPYVAPESHEQAMDLVAMVRSDLGKGAAILVGRDGARIYLVTANHVVREGGADATQIEVQLKTLKQPRWLPATLLPPAGNPDLDLAVLAIDAVQDFDFCALPVDLGADTTGVKRGDPVYPVGYPGGILWAMPLAPDHASQVFPTQISFESQFVRVGFSGGALANRRGEILGMIVADEPPLGRAVPFASILKTVRDAGYPVQLSAAADHALHAAAKAGDATKVAQLLVNCADPNALDAAGRTPLHEAAASGSAESVRLLLRAGARRHTWTLIREKDEEREWGTALHLAAASGSAEAVKALIENDDGGLETLFRKEDDEELERADLALHIAARHDRAEVAEVLIAAGAKIEEFDRKRITPLGVAAMSGSVDAARVLLRHGAEIAPKNSHPAPHFAAQAGQVEVLKLFVEHGVDVNLFEADWYLATPLHAAAASGKVDAAAYLISQKANVDAPGYNRATPLHAAAKDGTAEVVKLLLAHGADVNARDGDGATPIDLLRFRDAPNVAQALVDGGAEIGYALHHALDQHKIGNARVMILGGADVSLRDEEGRQPLHRAADDDRLTEAVELLLKRGAPVDAADANDRTPLHWAVHGGAIRVVELLLAAKASVDARTESGHTALQLAVENHRLEIVALLLKAGADPTPAVVEATSKGSIEMLEMLLAAGGDPNRGNPLLTAAEQEDAAKFVSALLKAGAKVITEGVPTTPFHEAFEGDAAAQVVKLLLGAKGNANARNKDGRTPLHMAAAAKNVEAVKALIEAGADVNAREPKCGETALRLAVPSRWNDERPDTFTIAQLLVAGGADVNASSTCDADTILDLAQKVSDYKVRQFLLSKGAKPARAAASP